MKSSFKLEFAHHRWSSSAVFVKLPKKKTNNPAKAAAESWIPLKNKFKETETVLQRCSFTDGTEDRTWPKSVCAEKLNVKVGNHYLRFLCWCYSCLRAEPKQWIINVRYYFMWRRFIDLTEPYFGLGAVYLRSYCRHTEGHVGLRHSDDAYRDLCSRVYLLFCLCQMLLMLLAGRLPAWRCNSCPCGSSSLLWGKSIISFYG